ncbi:hypothetical protein [Deinococcus sp.]|uniref:hypothetical protein n=1 Tax=Deinococcus sp. TaxID=47478 RepID=UPI003B5CD730
MKRQLASLMMAALLGTLTACGSHPAPPPAIGEKTPSQLKAEQLLGEWDMRYEGVNTYVTILKFIGTFQYKDDPSQSFAYGYDDSNNGAVGYFDFARNKVVMSAGGFDRPALFEFDESSSSIVQGCSYYKAATDGMTTPCRPFSGTYTSGAAQPLNVQALPDKARLQERYKRSVELLKPR